MKRIVVGLIIVSLMLQVGLLVSHFSMLLSPKAVALEQALKVICTDHGAATSPSDDTSNSKVIRCTSCAVCGHSGAVLLTASPNIAIVEFAQARIADFLFGCDLSELTFFRRPPSQGPPIA